MYITDDDDDDSFDECWYLVRVIEKQTFYVHKASREQDTVQLIWSQRKNKAIRFLTVKGLHRFVADFNLLNFNLPNKQVFVLLEEGGRFQGTVPVEMF